MTPGTQPSASLMVLAGVFLNWVSATTSTPPGVRLISAVASAVVGTPSAPDRDPNAGSARPDAAAAVACGALTGAGDTGFALPCFGFTVVVVTVTSGSSVVFVVSCARAAPAALAHSATSATALPKDRRKNTALLVLKLFELMSGFPDAVVLNWLGERLPTRRSPCAIECDRSGWRMKAPSTHAQAASSWNGRWGNDAARA